MCFDARFIIFNNANMYVDIFNIMKKLKDESYAHSHAKNIYTTWLRAAVSALQTHYTLPSIQDDFEKQPKGLSETDWIPYIGDKCIFKPTVFYEDLFIEDNFSKYFYNLYKKEIKRLCKLFFKKLRKGDEYFGDLGCYGYLNIIEITPKGNMIPNSCFSVFQEFPIYRVEDESVTLSPIAPPYGYIYWLRHFVNSNQMELVDSVFNLHYPLTNWEKNKILLGIDGCSAEQIIKLWNILCPQEKFVYDGKYYSKPMLRNIFDIGIQRHNPNLIPFSSKYTENCLYAAFEIINKSDVSRDKYEFCGAGDIRLACIKTDQILKQIHPTIIDVKNDPETNSFDQYKNDGKEYCYDCENNSIIFWKKKNWYLCEHCKETGKYKSVKHYYIQNKWEEGIKRYTCEDNTHGYDDDRVYYANKEYTPEEYL